MINKDYPAGVTVMICCYNSSSKLPITLKHLADQIVPTNLPWEIIVVDNASKDNTSEVAKLEWQNLHSRIPFRIVQQPIPGLNHARDLGIKAAKYDYVIMCDDDNWLADDYVSLVYQTMAREKSIGALGGVGTEICEAPPPDWFKYYKPTFAVGKFSAINGCINNTTNGLYGAGSTIRKSAYLHICNLGFTALTSDRKGSKLSSGGDTELFCALGLAGFQIWFNDQLKFKHYIASKSFEPVQFLKKMYYGSRSEVRLRPYTYLIDPDKFYGRPHYKRNWIWNTLAHLAPFIRNMGPYHIFRGRFLKKIDHYTVMAHIMAGRFIETMLAGNSDVAVYKRLNKAKWVQKQSK